MRSGRDKTGKWRWFVPLFPLESARSRFTCGHKAFLLRTNLFSLLFYFSFPYVISEQYFELQNYCGCKCSSICVKCFALACKFVVCFCTVSTKSLKTISKFLKKILRITVSVNFLTFFVKLIHMLNKLIGNYQMTKLLLVSEALVVRLRTSREFE